MGLRDRLKRFVRPPAPPAPAAEAPRRLAAPAAAWPAPLPVGAEALAGATVIELCARPTLPGALRPSRAELARLSLGGPVVVVCEDGLRSAGLAERLTARWGRPVSWLEGGLR